MKRYDNSDKKALKALNRILKSDIYSSKSRDELQAEKKYKEYKEALSGLDIPKLYETDGVKKEDKIVYASFFCKSIHWHVLEWDGADYLYCYVTGIDEDELGYSSLREISRQRYPVLLDVNVGPIRLGDLLKQQGS